MMLQNNYFDYNTIRDNNTPSGNMQRSDRKQAHRVSPELSKRQLDLAIGFVANTSSPATLREVLSPKVKTIQGSGLSADQLRALVIRRLQAQSALPLGEPGRGTLSVSGAIRHVTDQTTLGQAIEAIELRAMAFVLHAARRAALKKLVRPPVKVRPARKMRKKMAAK